MAEASPLIALDAMGGDHAPRQIVHGAVLAARDLGIRVALVGTPERIIAELAKHGPKPESISIVPASEVIEMEEHPAQAARHKKESSIVIGFKLLKQGKADALVSAGNTGAVMTAAIMYLGRLKGIERPVLVGLLPLSGRLTVFLDVGANADCKPAYLLQFAQMASAYVEKVWKVSRPRVALLNIGEEATKGNQLAQESYELLGESGLNFIGNLEGKDIPKGQADVIVTDGFTGNVVVKTMEEWPTSSRVGSEKPSPASCGIFPPRPCSHLLLTAFASPWTTASTELGRSWGLMASSSSAMAAATLQPSRTPYGWREKR